jgi:low affinity Fe/Cu permease
LPSAGDRGPSSLDDRFRVVAHRAADVCGRPWAFGIALIAVIAWALAGPWFHFSETWQLVINTATTIITFLLVFLIQATQNRDARSLHLKLDELIRASTARNRFAHLEDASDEELEHLDRFFQDLRRRSNERSTAGS